MNIREIILDTETTGLSPKDGHRIVEIGAVEMVNKVLTGQEFHCYINPERDMPSDAYRIHGISSDFLQTKPLFKDITQDFLKFIDNATLVIHNAQFDIKFLNNELSLLGEASLELSEAIDTLHMARKKFPGARASLDALCKRFKIDNSNREQHGALIDARLLADVYVELTGGRQSSFSIQSYYTKNSSIELSNKEAVGNKLIIQPSDQEKALHADLMQKICK